MLTSTLLLAGKTGPLNSLLCKSSPLQHNSSHLKCHKKLSLFGSPSGEQTIEWLDVQEDPAVSSQHKALTSAVQGTWSRISEEASKGRWDHMDSSRFSYPRQHTLFAFWPEH